MKKKCVVIGLVAVAFLCVAVLGAVSAEPFILGKTALSESQLEAIESQAEGRYSDILPLMPIYVSVDKVAEGAVYYTIHYFPFGTVSMSYAPNEGYNMKKPLTGS